MSSMKCPDCGEFDNQVVDTRTSIDDSVRRRRRCSCGSRFTTYERWQKSPWEVIKRDGGRQPWDREKLAAGIRKACVKRPVDAVTIANTCARLEITIFERCGTEVETSLIGEAAADALRELDPVACLRFISVFRRFEVAEEFADHAQLLGGV